MQVRNSSTNPNQVKHSKFIKSLDLDPKERYYLKLFLRRSNYQEEELH